MFEVPGKYIPVGAFSGDKLVAFYSAVMFEKDYGICYSAMVHPLHRKKQLIQYTAQMCYDEVAKNNGKYVYLFANKAIKDIYLKYLGFFEAGIIKEYNIDYDKNLVFQFSFYEPIYPNEYVQWRYAQHPLHQDANNRYIYYHNLENDKYLAFSTYEDRVQILDYVDINDAIHIGMAIVHVLQKKRITFWSEENLPYTFKFVPTWKLYKPFKNGLIKEITSKHKTRMCQSDVF